MGNIFRHAYPQKLSQQPNLITVHTVRIKKAMQKLTVVMTLVSRQRPTWSVVISPIVATTARCDVIPVYPEVMMLWRTSCSCEHAHALTAQGRGVLSADDSLRQQSATAPDGSDSRRQPTTPRRDWRPNDSIRVLAISLSNEVSTRWNKVIVIGPTNDIHNVKAFTKACTSRPMHACADMHTISHSHSR